MDESLEEMYAAIRHEVLTDPTGRGYEGKTVEEIAELMNMPYEVEGQLQPCRTNQCLVGIPFTPNILTPATIATALEG